MNARAIGALTAFLLGGVMAAMAHAAEAPPGGLESLIARKVKLFTRLRAEQINGVFELVSIPARLEADNTGRPRWAFTLGTYNVLLIVYDGANLNDGSYDAIQLLASFQPPAGDRIALLERCNEWNRTQRFATALLVARPSLVLTADLSFAGGVSLNAVREFVLLYRASLTRFAEQTAR